MIEKGLIAEEKVCLYNDFLFSTFNELGPSDVLCSVRDESTKFVQTRTNTHPSGMDHIIAKEMCVNVRNDHYCSLVNAVQRHLCSNYCGGNKEGISCRFGFPMKCQDRTHLAIKEHIVTKRSKDASSNVICTVNTLEYTIELCTKRNGNWLNSHSKPMLQAWMANMDMRLVCNIGKVVQYLTKYITKTEMTMSNSVQFMIARFMKSSLNNGNDVISVLRSTMGLLMGSRVISKQETCHLLNALPLVSCSHSFSMIHLEPTSIQLLLDDDSGENENSNVSVYSIVQMYAKRLENDVFHMNARSILIDLDLRTMTFNEFVTKFYVGKRGDRKNKILPVRKSNVVPVYFPTVSSNPLDATFVKYCKLFLIKYNP